MFYSVPDYDAEAARYDATRGGEPRAAAAARAIAALLPPGSERVIDLACGTGIVTAKLGPRVAGLDLSAGMAAVAAGRMPGRVALGDVTSLPLAAGTADAVIMIWLLHLLDSGQSAQAIAETARVLRPGGVLITTIDKSAVSYRDDDDAAVLIRPVLSAVAQPPADSRDRVTSIAARHAMVPCAHTTFPGHGQGMSPHDRRQYLRGARPGWVRAVPEHRMQALDAALAALPRQHDPRPDPEYSVLALRKS